MVLFPIDGAFAERTSSQDKSTCLSRPTWARPNKRSSLDWNKSLYACWKHQSGCWQDGKDVWMQGAVMLWASDASELGHVSMQTKWGTTKYVWRVIRPKHSSWHSLYRYKEKKNHHEPQKLTPCKRVRKGFVCDLENGCFEVLQRQKVKKETQHGVHWRIRSHLPRKAGHPRHQPPF